MTITQKIGATTTAIALTSFIAVPSFAQQPQPKPSPAPEARAEQRADSQRDEAKTIEGELVSVDATAKTLVVKTEDGTEESIRYDDDTKVTGAEKGVAGLANAEDNEVRVKVKGSGFSRVATEIHVEKKS